MNAHRLYIFLGYLSMIVGIACALSIYRMQTLFYGIALSILGFITSGINISLHSRHNFDDEKYPKGYWGMLLSSFPILFLLFLKYKH